MSTIGSATQVENQQNTFCACKLPFTLLSCYPLRVAVILWSSSTEDFCPSLHFLWMKLCNRYSFASGFLHSILCLWKPSTFPRDILDCLFSFLCSKCWQICPGKGQIVNALGSVTYTISVITFVFAVVVQKLPQTIYNEWICCVPINLYYKTESGWIWLWAGFANTACGTSFWVPQFIRLSVDGHLGSSQF